MSNLHKVMDRREVEFTIRAESDGSVSDGSFLWSFDHCEDYSDEYLDDHELDDMNEWLPGLPAMTGKQLAEFAMWLVSIDGIANPRHPGRCDDEASHG